MNFVVSTTELLSHLQSISKAINPKANLPILENFLFELHNQELKITASDLETRLVTTLKIDNVSSEGDIAIPARLLLDTLKEFSEQPLTFTVDPGTLSIEIKWATGNSKIPGYSPKDYPTLPELDEKKKVSLKFQPEALLEGINKTYFATADDELRPVMNGIFFDITEDDITFVASDVHKLVRYKRTDVRSKTPASFILNKKPASLLKSILAKETNTITLEFDDKYACFGLTNYNMSCRLIEGTYPNYNSVIPTNNENRAVFDRVELLNCVRRVAVFSNQASNLIKFVIAGNEMTVSAQDLDYSISAVEHVNCQYDGEDMEIGFKSTFVSEILSNLSSQNVVLELSDSNRAGLFLPFEKEDEVEDTLILLMPMMIGL